MPQLSKLFLKYHNKKWYNIESEWQIKHCNIMENQEKTLLVEHVVYDEDGFQIEGNNGILN